MIFKINIQKGQIQYREFHINQFPVDRIFVKLENFFHQKLFLQIKKYKFKEFNKLFFSNSLNWSTFKLWRNRKHFIPLWFILQLSEKNLYFYLQEFERNIISMKGPSSSSIIKNPVLPLKEDGRLLKILAHLLGDGSVGGGFGTKLPKGKQHSEYRNFKPELLDSFQRDLSVFGKVHTTKNYRTGTLVIPNLIGYILQHIYEIKFDTFNSRIPNSLFKLPSELLTSFFRAFGDDEGHVYDSSIAYYSNNKDLLQDILILLNQSFPKIKTSQIKSNSKAGKNIKYSFTVYKESQQDYLKFIGFDHPQKTEDLLFNLTRRKYPYNKKPKQKILNYLSARNLTAKQISRLLKVRHSTSLNYLNELKQLNKVKILRKEGWSNIWNLKD